MRPIGDSTMVTFKCLNEHLAELDRISEKRNIPRSEVLRMIVDVGVGCHKDMEAIGLISAVDFVYYVKQALKKRLAESGEAELKLI